MAITLSLPGGQYNPDTARQTPRHITIEGKRPEAQPQTGDEQDDALHDHQPTKPRNGHDELARPEWA
jgi:hypothetical protein